MKGKINWEGRGREERKGTEWEGGGGRGAYWEVGSSTFTGGLDAPGFACHMEQRFH
jgi:hypothetical protein